ncbi:PEPxxWA-CTERM sorting domain-containing protein [Glacieibacterium frigidum]|uniref:PEP-CTERM sorting domain-containing protein n=1 Tax=Glacieibacterium frigidum TaxID=2593303 RepID=A0A552UHB2_9SPHN|nr:PEPxxWA-CTERM sorting domain-containing protein [Glacieibacterium frigidum]TRW17609.1 PEP-CTERM sorting domain-containing protein [Glacieibacterium frigidum]
MKSLVNAALIAGALSAPALAAPTVYSDAAAFAAATTGLSTNGFEGVAAGQSTWILQSGSYSQPGFTITQNTNNAFNTDPAQTSYYYNWGTGDVINTPYSGTLTVTFSTAVTAFGLDLGTFYSLPFPFPPGVTPGVATTRYGVPVTVGTSQGNFTVATNATQNFAFFGVTSDTAFTSFTLSAAGLAPAGTTPSIVFDNLSFGTAVAAVPEPATWGLMIVGFGLVGAGMRKRRTLASAA